MKTYVTVCKNTILSNLKHGTNKPAIRISQGKYGKPKRVHKLEHKSFMTVRVVCDMKNPLPWGARCWMEIET